MSDVVTIDYSSPAIIHLCSRDKQFEKVFNLVGSISYAIHSDPFVFLVHEIVEQMLSKAAAEKIFYRLSDSCGGKVSPESISSLSIEKIRHTGTSWKKAEFISNLAQTVIENKFDFAALEKMSDESAIHQLKQLSGVGTWTAKMYLIFVLNRQDILPYEDAAFLQAYRVVYNTDETSPKSIKQKCSMWSPYSSIAARYMYRLLDGGLLKQYCDHTNNN